MCKPIHLGTPSNLFATAILTLGPAGKSTKTRLQMSCEAPQARTSAAALEKRGAVGWRAFRGPGPSSTPAATSCASVRAGRGGLDLRPGSLDLHPGGVGSGAARRGLPRSGAGVRLAAGIGAGAGGRQEVPQGRRTRHRGALVAAVADTGHRTLGERRCGGRGLGGVLTALRPRVLQLEKIKVCAAQAPGSRQQIEAAIARVRPRGLVDAHFALVGHLLHGLALVLGVEQVLPLAPDARAAPAESDRIVRVEQAPSPSFATHHATERPRALRGIGG
mmetsp:Transcript_92863/g.284249  ORF Transcript_92863/g.284249 Transcript_92863/m.284249 type:complete len:276 (-) Transcript_92863:54-881(-)